jgi:hypothetical protein
MLEIDDPYYANEADDWSYVVNTADIQGLAGVSYTGGWWDQVTDNTNPVAVTTHNYSYYSVSTENTDNMGEFSCSVLGWPAEGGSSHRLRIKSGLITFLTVGTDYDYGLIDTYYTEKNLRINEPNIYPEGSLHTGLNDNPDYIHSDGYIELTEGVDYYVFLFKVTPDWNDFSECKAPQLVISKVGDSPNTAIQTINNGGGEIIQYYVPNGRAMPSYIFGEVNSGEEGWTWEEACLPGYVDGETGYLCFDLNTGYGAGIELLKFEGRGNGYFRSACWRKDIAYIKWDSGESKFKVKQLHTGPVMVQDRPIYSGTRPFEDPDDAHEGWGPDGRDATDAIVDVTFSGYTKSLNDGTTNQSTGSTTANTYIPKQPSQIESPEIT